MSLERPEPVQGLPCPRPAVDVSPDALGKNLRSAFGHGAFRPHQEEVCQRLVAGDNVLLVMPTGAGKSLCYQLPGLTRGGVTLVVSPLIALMEDQVQALSARGLKAERIHSGRDRMESRDVCRRYLEGELDFLFIAPERLRVRGFPEFLARRPPTLVAIDEAHCISEWGHDFRPDYRLLSERLPVLSGGPIIAMTATATRDVQDDIASQLGVELHRSIHGFRRHNLAVEVAEVPQAQRPAVVRRVLSGSGRLPAILYVPSRKKAEELAAELDGPLRVQAYHAGLPSEERDRVQRCFLADELDVIVATIAFGMGVDKPNVRTVMHLALPGTVEGYYQEIGRAGRDGQPSVAILLHSFQDRRTHEWFHERDYPEPEELSEVHALLAEYPQDADVLGGRLGWETERVTRALDKLVVHGGAQDDYDGVTLGTAAWRKRYIRQREYRRAQLSAAAGYVETAQCRMLQVIAHFGDLADHGRPCEICDVCAPEAGIVQTYGSPSEQQTQALVAIVRHVADRPRPLGELFRECVDSGTSRAEFEELVSALCRSGVCHMDSASFERAGNTIRYRRLERLSHGAVPGAEELKASVRIKVTEARSPSKKKRASGARSERKGISLDGNVDAPSEVVELLRTWRLTTAQELGVPAFRVFSNKVLVEIARERPTSRGELSSVHGVGARLVERHGDAVIELLSASAE